MKAMVIQGKTTIALQIPSAPATVLWFLHGKRFRDFSLVAARVEYEKGVVVTF